jgi:hypothetical protein
VEVKHSDYCRVVDDAAELMSAAGGIMAMASSCCAAVLCMTMNCWLHPVEGDGAAKPEDQGYT